MATSRHLYRLRDERWISRRLEILAVRGNDCQGCGARGGSVHIHHQYYEGDKYPWDYEDETLWVLCATCHGKSQALMSRLNQSAGRLDAGRYRELVKVAEALLMDQDRERAKSGEGRGVLVVRR